MEKIELILLESGAAKFNTEYPFTVNGGDKAPMYFDGKAPLGFPAKYQEIGKAYQQVIYDLWKAAGEPLNLTIVSTSGAIFWGTLAASTIVANFKNMYHGHDHIEGLPFAWVLPEPKKYGLYRQVEGAMACGPDASVVIIEDAIKTGKTSLAAAQAIRQTGANILGVVAMIDYGFPKVAKAFAEAKVPVKTLTTYDKLVSAAVENGYLSAEQRKIVDGWNAAPEKWGK